MKNIGIVGWRGMVGSVLVQRMSEENDFENFKAHFFSTSQAGEKAPNYPNVANSLLDANDLQQLSDMDIIVSCQGSEFTKQIHPELKKSGWNGYWIDAASALRYEPSSTLVLDPVNKSLIESAIADGKKDFIGSNCTVSTMLMGIAGLFEHDLVEWMSSMSYQAVSGAGAKNVKELLKQMRAMSEIDLTSPTSSILDIEQAVTAKLRSNELPHTEFGVAIAGNVLPWIDSAVENGQSREEWKSMVETNLIMGNHTEIPIDGTCVRVGAMRCHSQALTIKLNKNVPINELEEIIANSTDWTELVPNTKEASIEKLTPVSVSGKLDVRVGRVRKMKLGSEYLNAFVVGDQLLWGAAEPLRRMVQLII